VGCLPLPDSTFDLAISEYGASIWCDPDLWIAEAARLLRSGGELVFLRNSTLSTLCSPDYGANVLEQLQRSQRGLHMLAWPEQEGEEASVEFATGHGEMFRLLLTTGFEVLDLIELYASDDAVDHPYYQWVSAAWAKKWPAEEIWRSRKR
jgi:ubiquinone/menaquinone biosynthesis C-methylase UbiE